MGGIRRSLLVKPTEAPTSKDRELVDFSRFPFFSNNQMQPVMGVSYSRLLEIATGVCRRKITELTEIRTKAQLEKVRRLVRREWTIIQREKYE